jgi:nitrite reductase (NO-forming)
MTVWGGRLLFSTFLFSMGFLCFFVQPVGAEALNIHLTALDKTVKVAKDKSYQAWTFEGFMPGPVIRVPQGEEVDFTFENKGSVDPMEVRENSREIVLVQSEIYSSHRNIHGMLNGEAQFVVFNGYMNKYVETPLEAKPGELIRWYVLNAGPNFYSSFHIVGGMFSKVLENGNPSQIIENVSIWTLPPGGGAIFETRFKEEGVNSFKTHALADSYRGAMGFIRISKEAGPPGALMP